MPPTPRDAENQYIMINSQIGEELNSLLGPVLFVMILAYFVADMFMMVYSMAIDVLMHCFMSDKEIHHVSFCHNNAHSGIRLTKRYVFSNTILHYSQEDPSKCYAETCEHLANLHEFVNAEGKEKESEETESNAA